MVGSGVENNIKLCCRINKIPVLYCLLEIRVILVLLSLNYNEEFLLLSFLTLTHLKIADKIFQDNGHMFNKATF